MAIRRKKQHNLGDFLPKYFHAERKEHLPIVLLLAVKEVEKKIEQLGLEKRVDRLANILQLLTWMIERMDICTMKVGDPRNTERGFENFSFKTIAEMTKMTPKTVWRTFQDLKSAGLVSIGLIGSHLDDSRWINFAAEKKITKKLFELLGLKSRLNSEQEKRAKDKRKITQAESKAAKAEKKAAREDEGDFIFGDATIIPKSTVIDPPECKSTSVRRMSIAAQFDRGWATAPSPV